MALVARKQSLDQTLTRKLAALSTVVLVGALVAALVGVALVTVMFATRSPVTSFVALGEKAEAGGVWLNVSVSEWVDPGDMNKEAQVYPMPASMMPGMPDTGQGRLHIELTLQNPGDGPRGFGPDEFHLESDSGTSWSPIESSFIPGTLGPAEALEGDIFFDVPQTDEGLYLVWTRSGIRTFIPAANGADAKTHIH